jgi:hypothetical protein
VGATRRRRRRPLVAGNLINIGGVEIFLWGEQSAYYGEVLSRRIVVGDRELTDDEGEELGKGLLALVAESRRLREHADALATANEMEGLG